MSIDNILKNQKCILFMIMWKGSNLTDLIYKLVLLGCTIKTNKRASDNVMIVIANEFIW